MNEYEFEIDGFKLVGGGICPEQYDVTKDGKQVGYLRLRHGYFTVDYPDVGGEEIFHAMPKGDGLFENDEREFYIREAVKAIKHRMENHEA